MINKLNLYHVQDNDRPMYVLGKDYSEALSKWRKLVADENDGDPGEDAQGICLIANADEILL